MMRLLFLMRYEMRLFWMRYVMELDECGMSLTIWMWTLFCMWYVYLILGVVCALKHAITVLSMLCE